MIVLKQQPDIPKARLPPHLEQLVSLQMENMQQAYTNYNPDHDGHLALITPNDTDAALGKKLGLFWTENIFEGVLYNKRFDVFIALILTNNQYCITLLIPDEYWLDTGIRNRLVQQLEGGEQYR